MNFCKDCRSVVNNFNYVLGWLPYSFWDCAARPERNPQTGEPNIRCLAQNLDGRCPLFQRKPPPKKRSWLRRLFC